MVMSVMEKGCRLKSAKEKGVAMSQLCASGGQRFGVSASTSVLPMNIQD